MKFLREFWRTVSCVLFRGGARDCKHTPRPDFTPSLPYLRRVRLGQLLHANQCLYHAGILMIFPASFGFALAFVEGRELQSTLAICVSTFFLGNQVYWFRFWQEEARKTEKLIWLGELMDELTKALKD